MQHGLSDLRHVGLPVRLTRLGAYWDGYHEVLVGLVPKVHFYVNLLCYTPVDSDNSQRGNVTRYYLGLHLNLREFLARLLSVVLLDLET